jgi:DNA-binding MarR family transcriptional regulator
VEVRQIGYYIKIINDKIKIHADADLKSHGLTITQSRVLAFLENNGGKASQKEIEDFLEVSHPTVVGIVSRMGNNGFLNCWFDPKDRRNKIVEMTSKAKNIGFEMNKMISQQEEKMLVSLSDEQIDEFEKTLQVIYKNLE